MYIVCVYFVYAYEYINLLVNTYMMGIYLCMSMFVYEICESISLYNCILYYDMYSVHCTLYNIQCTLYINK